MDKEREIKVLKWKIEINKRKLDEYDYVGTKLAEANAKDIANGAWASGNWEHTTAVYSEYADLIKQRDAWRDEINELEAELVELKQ